MAPFHFRFFSILLGPTARSARRSVFTALERACLVHSGSLSSRKKACHALGLLQECIVIDVQGNELDIGNVSRSSGSVFAGPKNCLLILSALISLAYLLMLEFPSNGVTCWSSWLKVLKSCDSFGILYEGRVYSQWNSCLSTIAGNMGLP